MAKKKKQKISEEERKKRESERVLKYYYVNKAKWIEASVKYKREIWTPRMKQKRADFKYRLENGLLSEEEQKKWDEHKQEIHKRLSEAQIKRYKASYAKRQREKRKREEARKRKIERERERKKREKEKMKVKMIQQREREKERRKIHRRSVAKRRAKDFAKLRKLVRQHKIKLRSLEHKAEVVHRKSLNSTSQVTTYLWGVYYRVGKISKRKHFFMEEEDARELYEFFKKEKSKKVYFKDIERTRKEYVLMVRPFVDDYKYVKGEKMNKDGTYSRFEVVDDHLVAVENFYIWEECKFRCSKSEDGKTFRMGCITAPEIIDIINDYDDEIEYFYDIPHKRFEIRFINGKIYRVRINDITKRLYLLLEDILDKRENTFKIGLVNFNTDKSFLSLKENAKL